jgi:hypothetical protein
VKPYPFGYQQADLKQVLDFEVIHNFAGYRNLSTVKRPSTKG